MTKNDDPDAHDEQAAEATQDEIAAPDDTEGLGQAAVAAARDANADVDELRKFAEGTAEILSSERAAFRTKVRAMEAKLRSLEPWLHELMRKLHRAMEEKSRVDEAWRKRLAEVEENRDHAVAEAERHILGATENRRAEEECRRLQTEIEQLEASVAMHEAVARAAQDRAAAAIARLAQVEGTEGREITPVPLMDDEEARQRIDGLQKENQSLRAEVVAAGEKASEALRKERAAAERIAQLERKLTSLVPGKPDPSEDISGEISARIDALRSAIAAVVREYMERLAAEIERLSVKAGSSEFGPDWLEAPEPDMAHASGPVPSDWESTLAKLHQIIGSESPIPPPPKKAKKPAPAGPAHDMHTMTADIPAIAAAVAESMPRPEPAPVREPAPDDETIAAVELNTEDIVTSGEVLLDEGETVAQAQAEDDDEERTIATDEQ